MPCRSSSRQTVLWATVKPCPASRCAAISPKVMSGVSSTSARISSAWASIRCERWSPPCGLGPTSPVRRHRFTHLIAVDRRRGRNPEAARRRAPRQAAVNRRYKPFSKIIGKRFRHAAWPPPPAHILNQKFDPMGIPKRIRQLRKCSSCPSHFDSLPRGGGFLVMNVIVTVRGRGLPRGCYTRSWRVSDRAET